MAEAPDENFKAAVQSQITFEAYFTGLAFTVLAFAVQSAKFRIVRSLTHWSSRAGSCFCRGPRGIVPG
jgi:hypothetical protein